MREYNGIDVSLWQGTINWKKVKSSGIDFVMIKASQGRTFDYDHPFSDPKFTEHIEGAYEAGLKIGVYHYFCAPDEQKVIEEADYYKALLAPYKNKIELWAAVDVEDSRTLGELSKGTLSAYVKKFCDEVKKSGLSPMVYGNSYWLNTKFDPPDYPVWEANLSLKTKPERENVRIWQYKFTGKVDGIDGDVDMNTGYFADADDVNFDGSVNVKDASAILKKIAGYDNVTDAFAEDVNGDNRVDSKDVTGILKKIASKGKKS